MPGFGDELGGYLPKVINRLSEWVFLSYSRHDMMLYKMQGNFFCTFTSMANQCFFIIFSSFARCDFMGSTRINYCKVGQQNPLEIIPLIEFCVPQ